MPTRPNILLILTDQQRWDTICSRTGCRTPNLNALAARGLSFDRSYSAVSLCCPARAMLLSGAYGWHNGVFNQVHVKARMQTGMRPGTVTYAQRLAAAGYQTAYTGKWHADYLKGPLDYGYRYAAALRGLSPEVKNPANFNPEQTLAANHAKYPTRKVADRVVHWAGGGEFAVWQRFDGPIEGRASHYLATQAIQLMDHLTQSPDPWLLEVHFQEPHNPFGPHVDFARRYSPADCPLPADWHEDYVNKPGMNRKENSNYHAVTDDDIRAGIAHYWAYTEELDAQIGRVLDALKRSGQEENTLVVFSSDHGEMLGNHGMFIKGWMPYEQTHRVPMLAAFPGHIPAGSRASQLVQLHDWAHTFCQLAGAEPMPYPDGIDLTSLISNPVHTPSRDAIMQTYYGGEYLYTQRILITDRHKYVFNGFDIDELYDLHADPAEMHNRIDDPAYTDVKSALQCRLHEMMDQFDDPYRGTGLYQAGRYLPRPD